MRVQENNEGESENNEELGARIKEIFTNYPHLIEGFVGFLPSWVSSIFLMLIVNF